MVFDLNLIAEKLVQKVSFLNLLRSYHAAPGIALYYPKNSLYLLKYSKLNIHANRNYNICHTC